jgi:tetratricopeptide (TPR) repeat protein
VPISKLLIENPAAQPWTAPMAGQGAEEAAAKSVSPGPISPTAARMAMFVVLAATFFVYALTMRFGFVYDDFDQIVHNPRVHSIHFLPQYFTTDVWAQLEHHPQNLYRPLFLTWLLANFKLFGTHPSYWHLTTILMHLAVAFLVYVLARKLIPGQPLAALVAVAIFALHPSHVEAVAWISGVTEPLAAVFFLGSFLCYLEYRARKGGMAWLASSLVLCAAAILAKETAVVLPAIIVSYEWFLRPQAAYETLSSSKKKLLLAFVAAAPFAVLDIIYFVLRMTALHGIAHGFPDVPLWRSLVTLPIVIVSYLSQLCVPVNLAPYYDVEYASGTNTILPVLVLLSLAFGIWWWARKINSRLPQFLSAWFLFTIAPVMALFVVISRYFNVHDRYLYLPSIAFALLAGQITASSFERLRMRNKAYLAAAVMLWVIALGLATRHQAGFWKDNLTLYARGAEIAPRNVLAKLNFASALFWKGRYADAFALAEQAVRLDPTMPVNLNAAGQAAYYMGNYPVAESYYLRALAIAPPQVDQLYYLGMARIKMKRYDEALAALQKGNSLWPNSPGYHAAFGQILAAQGNWEGARKQYQLELTYNPQTPGAKDGLAKAEAHLASSPR